MGIYIYSFMYYVYIYISAFVYMAWGCVGIARGAGTMGDIQAEKYGLGMGEEAGDAEGLNPMLQGGAQKIT